MVRAIRKTFPSGDLLAHEQLECIDFVFGSW